MVYIVMLRGPEIGKSFDITKDEIRIGRGTRNDIVIHDNEVSREHLLIRRCSDGFELTDLGSNNGTFINGHAINTPYILRSNCLIQLGDSISLRFYITQTAHLPTYHQLFLMLITDQNSARQFFPINRDEVVIGRGETADIQLIRPEVSREHFKISITDQGFFVQDMGSTNGTWVNNEVIDGPTLITMDDIIHISNTIAFQLTEQVQKGKADTDTDGLDTSQLRQFEDSQLSPDQTVPYRTMFTPPLSPSVIGTGLAGVSMSNKTLVAYPRNLWLPIVTPILNQMLNDEVKIDFWVDQYLNKGSPDWLLATEQARSECWALVVVVSPDTLQDEIIQRHILHFRNRDKPIITFIYEPVDQLPRNLSDAIRIDYNPALPNESLSQLIRQIKLLEPPSEGLDISYR
jgi:pSer/pThr/pTyr-binding forkhead associated (FHA) protein